MLPADALALAAVAPGSQWGLGRGALLAAAASLFMMLRASAAVAAGMVCSTRVRSYSGSADVWVADSCSTVENPCSPNPSGMPWNTATRPFSSPTKYWLRSHCHPSRRPMARATTATTASVRGHQDRDGAACFGPPWRPPESDDPPPAAAPAPAVAAGSGEATVAAEGCGRTAAPTRSEVPAAAADPVRPPARAQALSGPRSATRRLSRHPPRHRHRAQLRRAGDRRGS